MKKNSVILSCIILSMLLGWSMGYLRLPYIKSDNSFLIGFFSCLALLSLSMILYSKYYKLPIKTSPVQIGILSVFTIASGIILSWLFMTYSDLKQHNEKFEKRNLVLEESVICLNENKQYTALLPHILAQAEQDIQAGSDRQLSASTINKIVALNSAFHPCVVLDKNNASEYRTSPERGQLLLQLIALDMHPNSLNRIKQLSSFEAADLEGANLEGAALSGINLEESNLTNASLRGVQFNNANLGKARFTGAKMDSASLVGANLKRAILNWTQLDSADISDAILDGANLQNANIRHADLTNSSMQWAELSHAMFINSKLINVDFFGSHLRKANLKHSDLSRSNMRRIDLTDANLLNTDLSFATVEEENWMEQLDIWKIQNASAIRNEYLLSEDTTGRTHFMLIPKK